jgi:ectoine hydroxylase-related dioxygenase (phytanoyl-CoA dioxygenase family)
MVMTLPIAVDFGRFHTHDVASWLVAGRGQPGAAQLGAGPSLTISLTDGSSCTYRSDGHDVTIDVGGADGKVVAEMDQAAFSDFVNEMWSVFGLLYAGRVQITRGTFEQFAAWEPALQALWFDRPIYSPAIVDTLVDRAGMPLDLARSFTMADDHDEMAHFLRTTGYLVIRSVFSDDEVGTLNALVAAEKATAASGDNRSWWATDAEGHEVCCRLTYLGLRRDEFSRLANDPRLRDIVTLTEIDMLPCTDRLDGMSVVIKNPAIVSGLSDLPWHRDCAMGGHFVLCPGLNIGIQLDPADADNGQLWYLAGSHRHAAQALTMDDLEGLPAVAIDTQPGDVTVHFGHVLHAAPPPRSPTAGRKALYVGWHIAEAFEIIGPQQAYNDVLFMQEGGRVLSVEEIS